MMFRPIKKIQNPPKTPTLVWDGDCGFCKYWMLVFKNNTGDEVAYIPYQEAKEFHEKIPIGEFRKASRLIAPNGMVYSGPDSAYKCLTYFHSPIFFPHRWYRQNSIFRKVNDKAYDFIEKNRPLMMRLTKLFWGKNPVKRKPYWLAYLLLLIALIVLIPQIIKLLSYG